MNMLEAEFRRAVSDYLTRSAMSGRKLGDLALGDPEFVPKLKGTVSTGSRRGRPGASFHGHRPHRSEVPARARGVPRRHQDQADSARNQGHREILVRAGAQERGVADARQRRAGEVLDARRRG